MTKVNKTSILNIVEEKIQMNGGKLHGEEQQKTGVINTLFSMIVSSDDDNSTIKALKHIIQDQNLKGTNKAKIE